MSISIQANAAGNSGSLSAGGTEAMRFGADTSGQLDSFRNKVINGAFDIAQRGNGPFTLEWAKAMDRWSITWDGTGGNRTVSRVAQAGGEEIEGQFYYLKWSQTAAGSASWNNLETFLEFVRTLNGKTATLSFWAKGDTPFSLLNITLRQSFGVGGSPRVDVLSAPIDLTTAWKKYSVTFDIPSVAGKIITSNSLLAVMFSLPLAPCVFYVTNVQLEEGSIATPFENRPPALELMLCQRFFFRATDIARFDKPATMNRYYIPYPVPMRASPSVTVSGDINDVVFLGGTPIFGSVLGANFDFNNAAVGWLDISLLEASAEL